MPCKDTTSQIIVQLDQNEQLLDFSFSKMTCNNEIKSDTPYKQYCRGKNIQDLLDIDLSTALTEMQVKDTDEQFLMSLEWDALRTALQQYSGIESNIDYDRYKISAIISTADYIEIRETIFPPKGMPEPAPCCEN